MVTNECSEENKIVYKWFGSGTIVLSVAFVIYVYIILNGGFGLFSDFEHYLFLPEILISISIPVSIVFLTAGWLNQSMIIVDDHLIEVRSFPFPFPVRRIIEADNIIDIHARNNLVPSRMFQSEFYEIHVLNDRGVQKKVLGFLASKEKAEAISGELKKIVCRTTHRSSFRSEISGIADV